MNIKFTPTTLLHWYLGDGNFKRDKRSGKRGGRPSVRLFTNDFLDLEKKVGLLATELIEAIPEVFIQCLKSNQ